MEEIGRNANSSYNTCAMDDVVPPASSLYMHALSIQDLASLVVYLKRQITARSQSWLSF